ncbi:mitochondrial membrane Pet127 protein [Rutstroemia sp. NJR-2017a BBW]|nr:mitochondrial membrane Pet127 protein [Rutstroemia sp. NJR-2017a BBW]
MLGSLTRQGHRLQQSYVCTSCLEKIASSSQIVRSPLSQPRGLRTPARFSTTTRNCEAESTEPPEPKSGSDESTDKTSGKSQDPQRATRRSKSGTRRILRNALKDAEPTSQPTKKSPSAKAPKTNNESEISESLDSSGSPEATASKKSAGKPEKGNKKKASKKRKGDGDAIADSADVKVSEPQIRKVKTRLLEYISASKKEDGSSEKLEPSQLHTLFQELVATKGESQARRHLVDLIQNGGLTTSDRGKVMKELRTSLIQRPTPKKEIQEKQEKKQKKENTRPRAAQTLASMLASYESVHDAMKNGRPPKRSEAFGSDGAKGRRRSGPGPGKKIRTGPIPLPSGSKKLTFQVQSVDAASLSLTPVQKRQPPVPGLSYGLERALFNPGVYHLQDPRSRVFNFDPYLQTIMPVNEFDFTALKQYITSSRDTTLIDTAIAEGKKYTGSTSSMTASLAHFHFLLSQWRPINTGMLSQDFPVEFNTFTLLQRGPSAIFLRWRNGTYAIDADKEYDNANILSMLGKSMEKLLTIPKEEFEQYRKANSDQITEDQRNEVESFHYTSMGDFLMRSQLDAHDPRLPGTGMFDLKTRAVVSIRMDIDEYEQGSGYQIHGRHGEWESFEREYYDMIRAAFLKYSLQVRMGRMDGIFVAFHNVERIFGFQYISLPEMDYAIHGANDTTLGDAEFKLSLELLNRALDRATKKFPEKSLRIHFETRGNTETPFMYIFVEPIEEEEIQKIQDTNKAAVEEFESRVLGLHHDKSENELLEEKKNAEWADLRAQVEESMEKDELDAKNARTIAENLLARHEEHSSKEGQDGEPGAIESESPAESPAESREASDKVNDEGLNVRNEDTAEDILGVVDEEDSKDILAMHLTIRNKVDGEYVVRPERLNSKHNWTVEYALTEIEEGVKSRNLYKACKARRRTALTKSEQKEEDVRNNIFIENLKRLADKGRQWRKQQDEVEKNMPVKTLDYREPPKEVGLIDEQPEQPEQPQQVEQPEQRLEENKPEES